MPKQKTRKTLIKRIRITKTGKILTKQVRTGHLKRKWSTNKRFRKGLGSQVLTAGYRKVIKNMLPKQGKDIKK